MNCSFGPHRGPKSASPRIAYIQLEMTRLCVRFYGAAPPPLFAVVKQGTIVGKCPGVVLLVCDHHAADTPSTDPTPPIQFYCIRRPHSLLLLFLMIIIIPAHYFLFMPRICVFDFLAVARGPGLDSNFVVVWLPKGT